MDTPQNQDPFHLDYACLNEIFQAEEESCGELVAHIRQSHQLLFKIISHESCTLATTMEEFIPGFWGEFFKNRQTIQRDALSRQKQEQQQKSAARKHKMPWL